MPDPGRNQSPDKMYSNLLVSGHTFSNLLVKGHTFSNLLVSGHTYSNLLVSGHKYSDLLVSGHTYRMSLFCMTGFFYSGFDQSKYSKRKFGSDRNRNSNCGGEVVNFFH